MGRGARLLARIPKNAESDLALTRRELAGTPVLDLSLRAIHSGLAPLPVSTVSAPPAVWEEVFVALGTALGHDAEPNTEGRPDPPAQPGAGPAPPVPGA